MANKLICSLLLLIAATSTCAAGIGNALVLIKAKDGTPICVGVLVKKDLVVTAATCINFYDPNQLEVSVNNDTEIIQIAAYTFKPDFDFTTMENDVAVLRLAKAVSAEYITLASRQRPTGTSGLLAAWYANNTMVNVDATIISADECVSGKYIYEDGEVLKDSMVCGLPKDDACGFLPGSPLISKNHLVGLASWGYGCGNKGEPTVFMSVPSLIAWIKTTEKSL